MQRWTPIAGCVEQPEGTHITWSDHCEAVDRLTSERDNAEKREYELLGRANALDAELNATRERLDASDELLREEFAQRQDAIAYLTPEQRMEYQAHLNAATRHVADHLAALARAPLMAQTGGRHG